MDRLSIFFLISILFSHSAWAFHDIELDNTNHDAYTQVVGQNTDVDDSYDHCGHTSSHLVGLHSEITVTVYIDQNSNIVSVKDITSSISYQPPVPPPTS